MRRIVHLPHRLRQETSRDHRSALFHHLDLCLGADRHVEIGPGDTEGVARHLAQETLQDREGGTGAHGTVRSGEHIGEVISLGSDSHRLLSLLLLL